MENFTNNLIDFNDIPAYEEISLKEINLNYKKVVILNYSVLLAITLIVGIVLYFLVEAGLLISVLIPSCLVIILGVLLYLTIKALQFRGFAFREHDVISKEGIIYYTTSVIPNNRIQHIIIKQGVFSRMFGLCSLKIYSASVGNSDITIKGLNYQQAIQYKEYILNKIKIEAHD